jgi:hypothetical protein
LRLEAYRSFGSRVDWLIYDSNDVDVGGHTPHVGEVEMTTGRGFRLLQQRAGDIDYEMRGV